MAAGNLSLVSVAYMTGGRSHRVRRIALVVVLLVVAAAVGGVALYASTSEDPGGTAAAGAGATPLPSNSAASNSVASNVATSKTATPAATARPAAPSAPPALWQQTPAAATSVMLPVPLSAVNDPTTAGLTATLTPLLADHAFAGDTVAMLVTDAATGRVLFSHDAATAVPPASTAKLAVAVAALQVLGPDAQLTTRVVQTAASQVVLVGGGDPTLAGPAAVGPVSPGYPTPASLTALAAQTAAALLARQTATVTLGYDASLFAGPTLAPGWKPIYQTEGDVAPVSALEVDEGHPNPTRLATAADPGAAAAAEFAALLASDGVTVTGAPTAVHVASLQGGNPRPTLSSVASPPMSELVQRMLGRSDNDLAEALSRQVAIATGYPATFAGGVAAVKAAIAADGVDPTGLATVDASGLSPLDRVMPATLVALLRLAIMPGHSQLASILSGLPVAGFYGTLSGRFGGVAAAGAGLIRAKTGTLDGVAALAGYLQDTSGATLVFTTIATGVAKTATAVTEAALDRLTASLPQCGCRTVGP
jgi:D-alanyl-D-alanine carboxypeptidase/D-alanyl-D-alanine-endopeptidase (penicillin-binding protein 4)